LLLASGHPLAATHEAVRRRQPAVPQLLTDAPVRPPDTDEPGSAHEDYAAFALGVMLADWDWAERIAAVGGSAWRAYKAWLAEPLPDGPAGLGYVVARTVLERMAATAAARRRIRHTAREADGLVGGGMDAAAAAASDDDDDQSYNTDDDLPDGDADPPASDGAVTDSLRELLEPPTGDDIGLYENAMLGPLSGAGDDGLASRVPCGAETITVTASGRAAVEDAVSEGLEAAKAFDGYAMHAANEAAASQAADTPEARARLVAVAAGREQLQPGERIPYIRLPPQDRPSVAGTARLWGLNEKQAIAFALLADALGEDAAGRPPAEPVRLLLTGKAGTGKSRVLQALQWYALQIGAVRVLAVVAYTWRAALLLGTPDNPACTTTTFFAIDSFGKGAAGEHVLRISGKVRLAAPTGPELHLPTPTNL
jgi:hypothetical protein